jgi:hypothetical protein
VAFENKNEKTINAPMKPLLKTQNYVACNQKDKTMVNKNLGTRSNVVASNQSPQR